MTAPVQERPSIMKKKDKRLLNLPLLWRAVRQEPLPGPRALCRLNRAINACCTKIEHTERESADEYINGRSEGAARCFKRFKLDTTNPLPRAKEWPQVVNSRVSFNTRH